MLKTTFVIVICALVPASASAQVIDNPKAYGHWQFATENGLEGVVILAKNVCQYSVVSAHFSTSALCTAVWDRGSGNLTLSGYRVNNSFGVPEYQPQPGQGAVLAPRSSVGVPLFSFSLNRVRTDKMSGHMLGAGTHVSVKLRRH